MHETSDFLIYNNIFKYQVLCTLIYHRRSLYSFLLRDAIDIIEQQWFEQRGGVQIA